MSNHVGPFDATFRPSVDFGAIVMLDILEHCPDPVAVLVRASTLFVDGGRLFIHGASFPVAVDPA